jgi:hypothetical protein
MILNPAAGRYKNIYVERIPRLGKKYRDLGNDIEYWEGKTKPKTGELKKKAKRKIAILIRKRKDIESLVIMLLEQLPRLKEIAEKRDEQLKERELQRTRSKIDRLEAEINSLNEVQQQLEVDLGVEGAGVVRPKKKVK